MDDARIMPDAAPVSRLRDEVAVLLHNAAQCRDPEECDQLTREALALLDHARAASSRRAEHSAWPGQARSPRLKEGFPTMSRKLVAEFFGTFWLVLGGCGAAVLGGLLHTWLGVDDTIAPHRQAARDVNEALAPRTSRANPSRRPTEPKP